jgi:RNA recognition motif-containing protein
MISHKLEEDSLSKLFLKFGPIEDCKILRDLNGRSKCCAFITFKTKQSAANAIKFMHHNLIMENCHYPLNVKYADQFPIKLDQDQDSLILTDSDDQNDSALLSFQKLIQNINSFKPKRYKYDENEFKSELNDSNNCKYLFALNYDTLSDFMTDKFY